MKKILCLLVIPLLLACEKTIKYEIPLEPSKFSIDARIMTGDRLQVFVAATEYSLSASDPKVVPDAQVLLFENDVELTQLQWISNAPESGYYQTALRPSEGNSYRIEVFKEKYGLATGEALSLSPTDITSWIIDTINQEITISFSDDGSTRDFYSIRVYVRQAGSDFPLYLGTTDPSVDFFFDYGDGLFGDNLRSGYAGFLTDETFNGKIKTVRFEELFYQNFGTGLPDEILLEVTKVSEDLYLHEKSKGAQYTGADNPFAEPVQIYSNIDNGYGIVAAGAPKREIVKF